MDVQVTIPDRTPFVTLKFGEESQSPAIFTIGHSTHPIEEFIGILRAGCRQAFSIELGLCANEDAFLRSTSCRMPCRPQDADEFLDGMRRVTDGKDGRALRFFRQTSK